MWKQILKATLIAGVLDIIAACLNAYLLSNAMPGIVLKYIASGAFGKPAFSGGSVMILWGLFFHFIIVFTCTLTFFLIYPRVKLLQRSVLLNSILIALIAWVVTNLAVIPLSNIITPTFTISGVLLSVTILIVCIGVPISWIAKNYNQVK